MQPVNLSQGSVMARRWGQIVLAYALVLCSSSQSAASRGPSSAFILTHSTVAPLLKQLGTSNKEVCQQFNITPWCPCLFAEQVQFLDIQKHTCRLWCTGPAEAHLSLLLLILAVLAGMQP